MNWLHAVSYFFGGAFFTNAVPHFVSGVMGRPFQTPFARPPGRGLSSSSVNAVWGTINLVVGYLLVMRVGSFDARASTDIVPFGLAIALVSLLTARQFGRFHGGTTPRAS